MKALKENQQAIVGDLKASAYIFPHFVPVRDLTGKEIIDIKASWPQDIFEQYQGERAGRFSYSSGCYR